MATVTDFEQLDSIISRYFPDKFFYLKLILASGYATLFINGITQPISLFLLGDPSTKKSLPCLEIMRGLDRVLWSDIFSPASFVSGARDMLKEMTIYCLDYETDVWLRPSLASCSKIVIYPKRLAC